MPKRKVWVAKISHYDQYIVQPEDVASLMYLTGRMRRVGGYPLRLDTDDDPLPLCSDIQFVEVELPDDEPERLIPTPPPSF